MNSKKYFLSSTESYRFEETRELEVIREIKLLTTEGEQKDALLGKITPKVIGQDYGLLDDIEFLILTPRHLNTKISPIDQFPCFVHIARILNNKIPEKTIIDTKNLEVIAWGEIYKNKQNADKKVMS